MPEGIDSQSSPATSGRRSRPARPPLKGVPRTRRERDSLLRVVEGYVSAASLVPPLSLEELKLHTARALRSARLDGRYDRYAAVLVNNAVWRETLAGIPYNRRLLLLPQCLRSAEECPAAVDEFGLVCEHCGRCPIGKLQTQAEDLGYAVLAAEGTMVVTSLIARGKVDAIVGASCLSVLERVFPYMEAAAVPGIAIPLLNDGCANTSVDVDWLWEAVYLSGAAPARRLDLEALRGEVSSWFAPESLSAALGRPRSRTERIAQEWLARSGKRWRPFLTACASQAFQTDPAQPPPGDLRKIALAVECFHKASLIHDDIEDDDDSRYGRKTLHAAHGVPIALNVGDFLIGEGYRMLAECGAPAGGVREMLRTAALGHRRLCLGQGAELCWRRRPRPLTSKEVIDIFRQKTAPAFDVALQMAAIRAGASAGERAALSRYSEALGIAYQVRDDMEDLLGTGPGGDAEAMRPSLLLALACERAGGRDRDILDAVWRGSLRSDEVSRMVPELLARWQVDAAAGQLLECYKHQAVRSLRALDNANLKGLLRRVIGKIFDEIAPADFARDYQAGNARGGGAGAGPAA